MGAHKTGGSGSVSEWYIKEKWKRGQKYLIVIWISLIQTSF
jgi:hypothetical protein